MNSFKKVSLIIAAALTSTMLAVPAATAAVTTTVNSVLVTGATATAPMTVAVPDGNTIDATRAIKFAFTALETGTVVSAVSTGAFIVPALATPTVPVTASSGTGSISINTGTGNSAEFFVYTKTTSVGSVSVTISGNTTVYYVQGIAGALNSIALTAPATGAAGTAQILKVTGYDVFGNPKSGATINTLVSSNGTATATSLLTDSAVSTIGTKEQTVTLPASGSVVVTAYATVAAAVTGLAAPVGSVVATIVVRDLAGELASVTAQLAAEKAGRAADKVASDKALSEAIAKASSDAATAKAATDVATATSAAKYKAEYNALATKWNKKFPKLKVALKK